MLTVLVLVGLLALPFAARAARLALRAQWEQIAEQHRPPANAPVPIERVTADLRRLRAQLEARENCPGMSGKGMRMGALKIAYVQVLAMACRQLEIRPPRATGDWRTPLTEIYRVEAELRAHGLDVRQPGYPQGRAA